MGERRVQEGQQRTHTRYQVWVQRPEPEGLQRPRREVGLSFN